MGQKLRLSAVEHGYIIKVNGMYCMIDYYGRRANGKIVVYNLKTWERMNIPASTTVYVLTKEEEYECGLRLQRDTQ